MDHREHVQEEDSGRSLEEAHHRGVEEGIPVAGEDRQHRVES